MNARIFLIIFAGIIVVLTGYISFSFIQRGERNEGVHETEDGKAVGGYIILRSSETKQKISLGSKFILKGDAVGLSGEVAPMEITLADIRENSVIFDNVIDIFERGTELRDEGYGRVEIFNGTCYEPVTLVTDIIHDYCFSLEKENGSIVLSYHKKSVSTMPHAI